VSVQCVVTKGDSPLEITWIFDGRPIQSYHSDVILSDTGKRVKQLTIESVAARHAGEYTCVASNAAGSVSHSAILDVNGTPLDEIYARVLSRIQSNCPRAFDTLRSASTSSRLTSLSSTSLIFSEFLCDPFSRFLYHARSTTCVCVL
jgi:S-adenosylmethionine:diacylglycerol 3-amino-3-carboxypropyl transferase